MHQEQIKRLVNKLSDLEALADIIIIDTGAGISPSVMEFLLSSPETIIVTTPEPTSVTDSYALLKALSMNENYKSEECTIRMVANRVDSESEGKNLYDKLNAVVTQFLGIIWNILKCSAGFNCKEGSYEAEACYNSIP